MMRPNLSRAFAATFAAMLLVSAATASAHEAAMNDPTNDGADGHPDIVRTTVGHTEGGRLKHTIETDVAFSTPEAPCLAIRAVYPGELDYYVCGDGRVHRVSNDNVVGTAGVSRPNDRTIMYAFARKAIGASSAYRWRAESRADACPHERCDVSPDTFTLHEQEVTYQAWAIKFMAEMDAKDCQSNRIALLAWEANEGTQAVFNPLATTYDMPGATAFNSTGVRNYVSLAQGLNASRLTIERGWSAYGYGLIIKRLRDCAPALRTAKAIRASSWCEGCSGGQYVTGLIDSVRDNYGTYANRLIATH